MLPNFPPTLLRGIPNNSNQFFDNQGKVTGNVFRPHDDQEPVNGFYKISINWEDDDTVKGFTLRERLVDGSYHYKGGAARISLEKIEAMQRDPPWMGTVGYCRDPINGVNDYHGNLLLTEERVRNKNSKRALLARMQLLITEVIPPLE